MFVKQLGDTHWKKREAATKALETIGRPAVPALRVALKSKDMEVAERAHKLLLKLDCVYQPTSQLASPDADVRSKACVKLGRLGPDACEAIPVLIKALRDSDNKVRLAAVNALTLINLRERGVVRALVAAFKDGNGALRARAAGALVSAGRKGILTAACEMAPLIRSHDEQVRSLAVSSLEKMGPVAARAVTVEVGKGLNDERACVRQDAAMLVLHARQYDRGANLPDQAVGILSVAMRRGDLAARRRIANKFNWIYTPPAAAPFLFVGLEDADRTVQERSIGAIGRLGAAGRSALPRLLPLLERACARGALRSIGTGSRRELPAMRKLLTHKNPATRVGAAEQVWRISGETDGVLAVLVTALNGKGWASRRALLVLKDMGPAAFPAAVPALIRIVGEGNGENPNNAALALGAMGPRCKDAAPALNKAFENGTPLMRYSAGLALYRITGDSKRLLPMLIQGARHHDGDTRYWAILGLRQVAHLLDEKAAFPLADVVREGEGDSRESFVALSTLRRMGKRARSATPAMIVAAVSRNNNRYFALEAVRALAGLGEAAVPQLVEALKGNKNRCQCLYLLEALARIGPKARAATSAIEEVLRDGNAHTRCCAARALFRVTGNAKKVLPLLTAAITEKDAHVCTLMPVTVSGLQPAPPVRLEALRGLGKMAPAAARAIPAILRLLKDKDPAIRAEAALALGLIAPGDVRVVGALAGALKDPDECVRRAAALRLGTAGPRAAKAAPILEKALDDEATDVRVEAATALWKITGKPGRTVAQLTRDLLHPHANQAPDNARRLGAMGPVGKAAIPILRQALEETGRLVSFEAAVALWRMTDRAEKPLQALRAGLRSRHNWARIAAAQALGSMGTAARPVASELRALLYSDDVHVSEAARLALKKIRADARERLVDK
jgi:HEAT repeat protein